MRECFSSEQPINVHIHDDYFDVQLRCVSRSHIRLLPRHLEVKGAQSVETHLDLVHDDLREPLRDRAEPRAE